VVGVAADISILSFTLTAMPRISHSPRPMARAAACLAPAARASASAAEWIKR
jgi:hypothetical protein